MASVKSEVVGEVDGQPVHAFDLSVPSGLSVRLLSYGATLVSVKCPSATSGPEELLLSETDLDALRGRDAYYGATIGRVANRIARGTFTLDGETVKLTACNNGVNHLHGGAKGFDKRVWSGEPCVLPVGESISAGVTFTLVSEDGEEGYPGRLTVNATYSLHEDNTLRMSFAARVEGRPTIVGLCNHAYWNLSGGLVRPITDHVLHMPGLPGVLPVDETQIPTGEVLAVAGTPFDFHSAPRRVGDAIPLVDGGGKPGVDHCFVRAASAAEAPHLPKDMATVVDLLDHVSGRRMAVRTDAPGMQLYTGNFLSGPAPHDTHRALCLETGGWPDAINRPGVFPSPILRPGEAYEHRVEHHFTW